MSPEESCQNKPTRAKKKITGKVLIELNENTVTAIYRKKIK